MYRDTKKMFRNELPRLFGAISVALLHDRGVLSIDEQLRDFDAENRVVDRYEQDKEEWEGLTATERKNRRRYDGEKAPQPPRLPMFRYVPKALMTVRAANFFSNDPLPHEQLARVLSAFQGLASEIAGATARNAAYKGRRDELYRDHRHLFGSTFQGVFHRVSSLVDQIRSTADDVAELEVFFRLESLSTVIRWANQHRKIAEQFTLRGRGIGVVGSFGAPVSLQNSFAAPSLEGLEKFIKAVNAMEVRQDRPSADATV